MHETVAQAKAICDQKEGYSQTLLPGEVSTFTTSSITALLITSVFPLEVASMTRVWLS
jgi:hypothetical protein